MEELVIKPRSFNDRYYDQLEGDSVFVKAVNTKVSQYWIRTGSEMPILTAAISVLAELYNQLNSNNN